MSVEDVDVVVGLGSIVVCSVYIFFFFNETATTEIYTYGHTLSLHDALPISRRVKACGNCWRAWVAGSPWPVTAPVRWRGRTPPTCGCSTTKIGRAHV